MHRAVRERIDRLLRTYIDYAARSRKARPVIWYANHLALLIVLVGSVWFLLLADTYGQRIAGGVGLVLVLPILLIDLILVIASMLSREP